MAHSTVGSRHCAPSNIMKKDDEELAAGKKSLTVHEDSALPQFLRIHPLTALFLTLTQGLIQVPGINSPSSNSSGSNNATSSAGGSGVNRRNSFNSTASAGASENGAPNECSQFQKDEKQVLASFRSATRHAHYLLSGLLKRYLLLSVWIGGYRRWWY